MNNTALAVRADIDELQTIGQVFVKSGFFADTKDAAQAIVKVMAGAELGFPPIASMTGVYIVKGKVSLSANLMASAIKGSNKYNYRVRELTAQAAELEFFEDGESIGKSRFTMVEAKGAGLADNPTWQKFPRNMLFARALSNGAKWFTPDIFKGPVYTPEELGATVDGETGDVIEMPVEPTPFGQQLREEVQAIIEEELPEPELVRPVRLEGAQPTKRDGAQSSNGTVRAIMSLAGFLGWDGRTLANEVYTHPQLRVSISEEDPARSLEAMDKLQLKTLLQVLQSEKNKMQEAKND